MDIIASLENVSLSIGKKHILKDISFNVKQNQMMTVIGPNGAGKSSVLKLLVGTVKPSKGTIKKKKNLRIGYLPQKNYPEDLMPMSVCVFLENNENIIAYLEIEKIRDSFLYSLSEGELQKVMLARALIKQPDLLLLDEPTSGMDMASTVKFYELIEKIRSDLKSAIIIVSHDLNVVMGKADEVICINKKICCQGQPKQIISLNEFSLLFGKDNIKNIALYQHTHDKNCEGQCL